MGAYTLASSANSQEIKIHNELFGYPYTETFECSGRSLHSRVRNLLRGRCASMESIDEEEYRVKKAQEKENEVMQKYRESLKGKSFLNLTMYEQLGISEERRFNCTEDEIKQAYHHALLVHHPDKTRKAQNDPNYLAVQRAFNTLMDPKKKRAYDSLCDFDDWIPTGNEKIKQNSKDHQGKCFYALYGPIFKSNARFSEKLPVPNLGDENTPLDKVYEFYEFWHSFQSWREFTHTEDEVDTDLQSREERRHQSKKIENEGKKKKKKDILRIATLVDNAQSNDPRIKQARKKEKDAKLQAKLEKERLEQEKINELKRIEEEKIAQALLAEQQEKDKAKQAKFEKEKQKKAIRKLKKSLRELMNQSSEFNEFQIERVCETANFEQLQEFVQENDDGIQKLRDYIATLE